MSQNKLSIIIVGGGTAGWISAGMLNQALGDKAELTLIEAEEIAPIGVGEATVPTLRGILKRIGVNEQAFLKHCQATFKLGIKFLGWRNPKNGKTHQYYHPFGFMPQIKGINISEYWLRRWQLGIREPFDYSCSLHPWLCDQKKGPKFYDSPMYGGAVDYAYHLDTFLFADFLRNHCKNRGVQHQIGKVLSVNLDEKGAIESLNTDSHGKLKADLYVDCSGFQGLLINGGLGEEFISYSKSLLSDSAVAINVPRGSTPNKINPYTTAQALSGGWIWDIPLRGRTGTGYVYSSAYLSPEQAEKEHRAFIGDKAGKLPSHHINWRVGRNRRAWVKNCVAIGLAGGFVEPLESSGIGLIYTIVDQLIPVVKKFKHHPEEVEKFNQFAAQTYDAVRDFLIIHYCLSDREDSPFWKANQNELWIPDPVKNNLEQWKEYFPHENIKSGLVQLYNFNAICILAGLDYLPRHCKKNIEALELEKIQPRFEALKEKALLFAEHLPDHAEYLASF